MRPGDPVIGVRPCFSFFGVRGRVVTTSPLYVLFDGEREPMCVSMREIAPAPRDVPIEAALDSSHHVAGAE
jgi:hypothetical protein